MQASYYYKYDFISPEPIYAQVKEELKSYFQTGVVDDVLFPKYTNDCLKSLSKSAYKIVEGIFKLEDFECTLPEGFHAVRELWLAESTDVSYRLPSSTYTQETIAVSSEGSRCDKVCAPKEVRITYKTSGTVLQTYHCQHLLKPGNVHAKDNCSLDSFNRFSTAMETFDIRGRKLVTNFPEGSLYMVYYVKEYDENDYQLVPDNAEIENYLLAYLKYKVFENIYNNVSDETLKQIETKLMYYEQKMYEAMAQAKTEIKRQTLQKQILSTKANRRAFNKYNIT
jgi:hypothetical protein